MEVIYGFFKRFPAGVSKNMLDLGLKDTEAGCCHSWVGERRWEATDSEKWGGGRWAGEGDALDVGSAGWSWMVPTSGGNN